MHFFDRYDLIRNWIFGDLRRIPSADPDKDVSETIRRIWTAVLAGALALLLAACGAADAPASTPDPAAEEAAARETAEAFLTAVNRGDLAAAAALSSEPLPAPSEPETELGRLLAPLTEPRRIEAQGALRREGDEALLAVSLLSPDPETLRAALGASMQEALDARLEAARRSDEVLNADLSVREELLGELTREALARCAETPQEPVARGAAELRLRLVDGAWRVVNGGELLARNAEDADALAAQLTAEAAEALQIEPKHYVLPLDAKAGTKPDLSGVLVTDDPDEVLAVLARPEAQRLLAGRELMWSPELTLYPDSLIRVYLDESILVIVWQEVTAWACGTYAEVLLADGSQLCRRLADDDFEAQSEYTPTEFAAQTNAVLLIGGDFYRYPGRWNGICVYEGQIERFEPDTSDCCFVTDRGELLFVYRGQFETQEEAQAYVDEHHVRFSVCFGPVVIEDGRDVTPDRYRWGEIFDRYARALIGCREEGHFLCCAVNAQSPGYYNLVYLSDATEAMLAHGVRRAYTLDGGRTATICFCGEVINTVQSGVERPMSDVIFFASALPEVTP